MSSAENGNIKLVRQAINALNTGETTKVSEFISPTYFNHESQKDPVRSKMRGPQEFIDTVINIRKAFSGLHYELFESVASNEKVVSIEINSILRPFFIHSSNGCDGHNRK
jgi:hypothetical protein